MIHHISITARDPRHTADVLAEILGGRVTVSPPNFLPNSWFVLTGDSHGTLVEVLPYGAEFRPGDEQAETVAAYAESTYNASHALISVAMDAERILAIGKREGWLTRRCNRGPFEVIECWLENRQMIEFAPPEMAQVYLDFFNNPAAIQSMLAEFEQMGREN